MKKRTSALAAFLLCATMGLGVGYAAITDSLNIGGNASAKVHADGFLVEFSVDETHPAEKCTVAVQTDKTVATFTTTQLKNKNDVASATLIITNNSTLSLDAVISAPVITNSNQDYFTVATDFGTQAVTLKPGESKKVEVTVTLLYAVVEEQICEFNISFAVEALEQNA